MLYKIMCSAAAVSFSVAVLAIPKPMQLAAVYVDTVASEVKLPKQIKPCNIVVASLTDERSSPEIIGVFSDRAIHAPNDRDAWFRSMVAALKNRKIALTSTSSVVNDASANSIEITVTKAWISNTHNNINSSIVFRVKTAVSASEVIEQSFRGSASHDGYWGSGTDSLQRVFDKAVSRVLDAMATDVQKRCGNIA
jgi:uncharacterized lipoprotein YajG